MVWRSSAGRSSAGGGRGGAPPSVCWSRAATNRLVRRLRPRSESNSINLNRAKPPRVRSECWSAWRSAAGRRWPRCALRRRENQTTSGQTHGARLSGFCTRPVVGFFRSVQVIRLGARTYRPSCPGRLTLPRVRPEPLLSFLLMMAPAKTSKRRAIDARGLPPHRHEGSLVDKHERHQRQMAPSRELLEWGRAKMDTM